MKSIRAAGGVVWREDGRTPRIAVIHRPRRKGWSLPKGKLKRDERWEDAALREVREETGCEIRLAAFAGVAHYLADGTPKVVLYWNMVLVREGPLAARDEVDEVAWLPPGEALDRLDRESDRRILAEAMHVRHPALDLVALTRRGSVVLALAGAAGALTACGVGVTLALRCGSTTGAALLIGAAACGGVLGGGIGWLLMSGGRRD
jgi:ADP-ribose pyrophosphatase YjhB (NUDIX family)